MWRRQKGLEFWLGDRRKSPAPNHALKHREKPKGKVRPWGFKNSVQSCSLAIHSHASSLEAELALSVHVKDGLGNIGHSQELADRNFFGTGYVSNTVHELSLIGQTQVRPLRLPDKETVRIKQMLLSVVPYCRSMQMVMGPAPVLGPGSVKLRIPLIGGNGGILPKNPPIGALVQKVSGIPIRQGGIDINTLSESEYNGYLQEAGQIKGIPSDKCELIALFRHIPIELISKLHFLNDEKEIVYNLSSVLNRSRTRVYDLMVIREESRKNIHLVPHSTRNRTVILNEAVK